MITAVIVLAVIALALGGFITFDILCGKKKAVNVNAKDAADEPQSAKEPAPQSQTKPEATEQSAEQKDPAPQAEKESAATVEPETDGDGETASAGDDDDETAEIKPVTENGKTRYIVIKYSKSFTAKLIQSDDLTKRYYSEIKNSLLSYDGVKSRISWKWEAFRLGKNTLAKLRLRGKTLAITLALNPDGLAGTKYRVESLVHVKSYADTPCMFRVKNDRRLAYAKELIAKLAADNGLTEVSDPQNIDYAAQYPFEKTDALIERKLIKVLTDNDAQSGNKFKPSEMRESVAATEVDKIMSDEVAASLIAKSDGVIDKTKQSIINIDTLGQFFESGELVTLAEIKKRLKGYSKTTYIKVLARGTLDKQLIVEADSFSLQAVKMIVLTGGTAINKRA